MTALYYLQFIIPIFAMVVGGLLVPAALLLSYSRFGFGIILIFSVYVLDVFVMQQEAFSFGINLYYPDIVSSLIAAAVFLRMLLAKDAPKKNYAWILFCLLVVLSLMVGLISFGSTAGVQARPYFYFIVAGLYGSSFIIDDGRLRFIFNALAICVALFICLAVYRWIVYYAPINSLLPVGGSYNIDGPIRVIYSPQALLIAQVLVAGFFFITPSRGLNLARIFAPLLFGTVVVLQHRSVWLAFLIGVCVQFLLKKTKGGLPRRPILAVTGLIFVTLFLLASGNKLSNVGGQIVSSATRAVSGQDTTHERLNSWQEIVKNWYGAGAKSIIIGQSFGSDNSRFVTDSHGAKRKISYAAHNLYVQTLFNTGLLGLIFFVTANFYVVNGLYRLSRTTSGGPFTNVLLIFVIMQMVYYVPYGTDYLQGFIFGAALAYVSGKNTVLQRLRRDDAKEWKIA